MSLDSKIDDLYRAPLADFVANRTALAKTLSGAEAQQVRKLPKPTLAPWAVNQVYWRARAVYDRAIKSGERLRHAQVAALEGKKADLRGATDAHRTAVADAVREAERFAAEAGSHPPPDAIMRIFEALSLAAEPPEAPGRLTKPLQPAGFEALAGIKVKGDARAAILPATLHAVHHPGKDHRTPPAEPAKRDAKAEAAERREDAARRKREEAERKRAAAEQRKRDAAVKKAEAAVERARRQMQAAEEALRRTRGRAS